MNRRKFTFSVLVMVWALLLVFWPARTDHQHETTSRAKTGEGLYQTATTQANLGLSGVRFYETEHNKRRWDIRSKFAELHQKEDYAHLQEVDADFFAERTGNIVETQSDYGRCLLDKNEVELEGNVSIRSKRGYLFEMPKLRYVGKAHEFLTDDVVQMRGPAIAKPTMLLKGTGLEAEIDREYFKLKRNVTAQKRLKSSEWLRISSQKGEFHTEDQNARFFGKVRSTLPAANIESDELEISMKDAEETISAKGNVALKSRKRIGRADSAFIQVGSSKIILEGKASVSANDNQIRGQRIVLYSDDDRVEVEKAEGRIQSQPKERAGKP